MANILIWATVVVVLLGLFFLTLLNVLKQTRDKAEAAWEELDKIWVRRRDIVPYLLETAHLQEGERWQGLKNLRAELLDNHIPTDKRQELEEKFENAIEAFIAIAREHEDIRHDVGFLEAEKDLRKDIHAEIEQAKKLYEGAQAEYDDKSGKFPYIIAAKFIKPL